MPICYTIKNWKQILFSVNYFIYGYKDIMIPDTEIFLHKFIATKNLDLTKVNVIYCIKS